MINHHYKLFKRFFDIVFSLVLIIISSPIWLITIVLIKLSSPGPVFYMSNRVGINGKTFLMYKFRSMNLCNNADEKCLRPEQKRIFKFGHLIRNMKIDELPQLINVLTGQMTVVGPRPAAKDQISITRSGQYQILNYLKPGMTSPSALFDYIYGDKIVDELDYQKLVLPTRLALDLFYLNQQKFTYDLKIILYTIICISLNTIRITPKLIYNELISNASNINSSGLM